jgi:hypothetical protein
MRHVLLALSLVSLSACASMEGGPGGNGFTEEKISGNSYRVSYKAPEGTKPAMIADRAMARAAQVTLDHGQEWFEVSRKIDGESMQTLVIVMGQGETLAGGSAKQYDAKATLARLKGKIS